MTDFDAIVWLIIALLWGAGGFAAGFYFGRRSAQPR